MSSELAAALAKVQAELPAIAKAETANTGSYSYSYADLTAVSEKILPLLGKHGLAFMARPTVSDGKFVLAYSLMHASGEREDGEYPLPEKGTPQQLGGHITYARRYALCAVTGVAPGGEDNDAAGATEVHMDRRRVRIPGPDHERLQPRRTPDDRPAERGPVPPDDDLWAGQPAGEYVAPPTSLPARNGRRQPMTPAQSIALHFKRLGIEDDEERHNWIARMAGRTELASASNLPPEQQREILAALGGFKDIGQVQAWIDDKAPVS